MQPQNQQQDPYNQQPPQPQQLQQSPEFPQPTQQDSYGQQQPSQQAAPQVFVAPPTQATPQGEDPGKTLSLVGLIVAIFIPIVGIPMAAIGMTKSKAAGYNGKLGLIGIVVGVVSIILLLLASLVLPSMFIKSATSNVIEERNAASQKMMEQTEERKQEAMKRIESDQSSPSSTSSSEKPSALEVGECLQESGVDPNDLSAYAAAAERCQKQS